MKVIGFYLLCLAFSSSLFSQKYLPKSDGELIYHKYFTLSYNEYHEQANWVHYKLNPAFLSGSTPRTDLFKPDPLVSTKSAESSDYKGSGYDRGHLAPAADMKYDNIAMSESFYMSNISPQSPFFNRGIWRKLEMLVRSWGQKFEIYISTAGLLNNENLGTIGTNKVTIPSKFYKVIYAPSKNKMIGFLLPNEEIKKDILSFVVTIDHIESITGIDFFEEIPDDIENELESKVNLKDWDFSIYNSSINQSNRKPKNQFLNQNKKI